MSTDAAWKDQETCLAGIAKTDGSVVVVLDSKGETFITVDHRNRSNFIGFINSRAERNDTTSTSI